FSMDSSRSRIDASLVFVHRRNVRGVVLGLCTAIFVAVVFIRMALRWRASWEPFNEMSFSATVWRSQRTVQEKGLRGKMAGDLMRHYIKRNMTDKEVASLLGPPDDQPNLESFAPADRPDVREIYQYDMGHAWMDFAGQHFLIRLYFDERGRNLWSEITRD